MYVYVKFGSRFPLLDSLVAHLCRTQGTRCLRLLRCLAAAAAWQRGAASRHGLVLQIQMEEGKGLDQCALWKCQGKHAENAQLSLLVDNARLCTVFEGGKERDGAMKLCKHTWMR